MYLLAPMSFPTSYAYHGLRNVVLHYSTIVLNKTVNEQFSNARIIEIRYINTIWFIPEVMLELIKSTYYLICIFSLDAYRQVLKTLSKYKIVYFPLNYIVLVRFFIEFKISCYNVTYKILNRISNIIYFKSTKSLLIDLLSYL